MREGRDALSIQATRLDDAPIKVSEGYARSRAIGEPSPSVELKSWLALNTRASNSSAPAPNPPLLLPWSGSAGEDAVRSGEPRSLSYTALAAASDASTAPRADAHE